MSPEIEQALTAAAELAGAIGLEILDLPEFQKRREALRTVADCRNFIHDLRESHPALFRPRDWAALTEGASFADAEAAFREGLRKSRPIGQNEFRDLDASRLSPEELNELSRALVGQTNAYDPGILRRALARQRAEDGALSGDAS